MTFVLLELLGFEITKIEEGQINKILGDDYDGNEVSYSEGYDHSNK